MALLGTNDYQDCKKESFDVQLQECIVLVLQLYFQETLNLGGKDELLSLAAKLDSSLSTSVDQILVKVLGGIFLVLITASTKIWSTEVLSELSSFAAKDSSSSLPPKF